ncbi:PrsW family intramembrane metalloprotease [Haloarchaeobius amylolyticus]|uniref:PrsW family intramembrane metalloprotease n=1 Tax=Haloarchaeobius amylolyticus TaxID=1198296 RepID=UPI00226D68AB|nr:PrsW family glutamic-type intramembrane protease [Haloarchaeobius amylolyticus]
MPLRRLTTRLHRIVHWSPDDAQVGREPTRALGDERDLYEVSTWEPRSVLDRVALAAGRGIGGYWKVLLVAVLFVVATASAGATLVVLWLVPGLGAYTLLSVVLAAGITVSLWAVFAPGLALRSLVVTFALGVLLAALAVTWNTALGGVESLPLVGVVLYAFLVVAPGEEVAKLLAVRLYAYTDDRQFGRVVDGAVYGAVAGLAFATYENVGFLMQEALVALQQPYTPLAFVLGDVAATRLLSAPGHVLYTAFAGYYLGLARFNREHAGAIVLKGLLVVVVVHATFNVLIAEALPDLLGLGDIGWSLLVLTYDGAFGYVLYRKLARYRDAYRAATEQGGEPPGVPPTAAPPGAPPDPAVETVSGGGGPPDDDAPPH